MPSPLPVTQRAYTLRIRGADPQDHSWREALWLTHEAVNKGAKAFGDWLLTLRGGLDHMLADARIPQGKGKPDRAPTDDERKARRILLALSWLSVESERGAPAEHIVAHDLDKQSGTRSNWKTVEALREILKKRGLGDKEIQEWETACKESLEARIRDDAVWINRSQAFDVAARQVGASLPRNELWDMLERFLGSPAAYLALLGRSEDEEAEEGATAEKARDLVQKAGQWLSSRFGTGQGANFCRMANVYGKIAAWAENAQAGTTGNESIKYLAAALSEFTPGSEDLQGVLGLISGPGYKSATRNLLNGFATKTTVTQQDLASLKDKATTDAKKCGQNTGSKGQRPYSDAILKDVESVCGFTYRVDKDGQPVSVADYSKCDDGYSWGSAKHSEFAVILDHAARRVSLAHTWIKRAEAERRKFEEDAKKIDQIPEAAKTWLDKFCLERSSMSGALEPYRIRRRAVGGWKEVVAAWAKSSCTSYADRIAAARALQDDPEIDKFGDIQLFEALAEDDAVWVWHKDGDAAKDPDPQPVIDYALAAEAEFKKRHFKVPAYRHPDALLHPVFCDFGNSRWDICFAVHKNRQSPNPNALSVTLWTGSEIKPVSVCWQSKRLARDLALGQDAQKDGASEVTRADRLGRAAADVSARAAVRIAGLFEQEDWNGRLQAPRAQLDAIAARVAKHGWDAKAKQMCDHLRWLITFSAKLQPSGPWLEYAAGIPDSALAKPFVSRRGDLAVRHQGNDARKGHAKLVLSRLPGLRVLSVDLGHRYAAACAVWETLSAAQLEAACRAVGHEPPRDGDLYLHLKNGEQTVIYRRIGADRIEAVDEGAVEVRTVSHPAPWARLDRQFLIKLQGEDREARVVLNEEIWAVHQLEAELGRTVPLIDRMVKAGWGKAGKQGARLEALRRLGWTPANDNEASAKADEDEEEARKPALSVDEIMSSTVRTIQLGLKRHGDRARIAFAMTSAYKPMPGDRKYHFGKAQDASANDDAKTRGEKHVEFLQDALSLWHDLFSSGGWKDDATKALWEQHIVTLKGYQTPEEIAEDLASVERKKKRKENRDKLRAAAEMLAADNSLRQELHEKWKKRWEADDGTPAEVDEKTGRKLKDGTGWHARLRRLQDWLMPPAKREEKAIRCVGGLSLTRLATLTEFRRKVQVAFFTRLHPDGTRTEAKESFGQGTLDTLEHMREQRVKQLASRIAEAALGIGRMKRSEGGRDPKRPRVRVDSPCPAIVIENLTHYRPEETRTRRENRQLMSWSSSKVKKYLAEACQLHGLHLREVQAGYTSRQDSRTGAPGVRCQDAPVADFVRQGGYLWKRIKKALEEVEEKKDNASAENCLLNDLYHRWDEKVKTWTDAHGAKWTLGQGGKWAQKDGVALDPKRNETPAPVRIPVSGGEIFVSADAKSPVAKGLQADLNAAANIGLKALADPDWPGRWWYIPAVLDREGWRIPDSEKCQGATCLKSWRVAAAGSGGIYTSRGMPLSLGDDESVRRAEEAAKNAKEAWETAKKQTKDARKGRATVSLEAAEAQEREAKSEHEQAKNTLSDARKAASAKQCINLWRDVSSRPILASDGWREFTPYWNSVQARVVSILRQSAELIRDQGER